MSLKSLIKKSILVGIISFAFLFFAPNAFAQTQSSSVNLYFFWGDGCPHCAREKPFLEKLENRYSNLKVHRFEVWYNSENQKLFLEVGKKLKTDVSGVPFTVIGKDYIVGYFNDETTGKEIEDKVLYCSQNECPDVVGEILGTSKPAVEEKPKPKEEAQPKQATQAAQLEKETSRKINLPIFGEIDPKNFSLPALTIIIGALDGFNPCAMWTLLFLISLLLGMKDRKRMWILGSAFIIASASVYFLFMAAWLNLILFLGFIVWVRILIGLVALVGGGYNLRKYFSSKESGCEVVGDEQRQKVFEKLKAFTQKQQFWLALGGIILLAAAVNLVDLVCSAGFPAVYTQILALSNLARWQYYFYLSLYIFVFMLDDIFVFFAAMITLQMVGVTTKYTRASHLVGGILMVIIGFLLIFKPGILMFG